ncbi:helix-turn-helix transcriptional regulator [Luteibacter pinisoli]|uniref:Helix-turn-helix transcriptional regulator n=1 Tax=Luteibacter pinisoli TaxID=2589080 RepID=A0A4Y5YYX0_9GAMM|nr:helix-turn-helix transcriptional regulator [Luteibacter pinisoli]
MVIHAETPGRHGQVREMQSSAQHVASHDPGVGFFVDPTSASAACRSDNVLRQTLATLRARRALDVLEFPGAVAKAPMLVAYGADRAEWGVLLRQVPELPRHTPRSTVDQLCALLGCLAEQREFASTVFAEVALALRAAHAPGTVAGPVGRVPGGLTRWQYERAVAWMDERLDATFTSTDVATHIGMSAGHFTRAFRVTEGTSPRQWVLQRRVQRAKAMLADAALTLSDIALACGFAEQSHFTRVFTRLVGMPPGAWRRSQ